MLKKMKKMVNLAQRMAHFRVSGKLGQDTNAERAGGVIWCESTEGVGPSEMANGPSHG